MPILGSLASGSVQAFGSRGLVPTGSGLYNSIYDSLSVPPGTPFQYGTGDFTVEMWFYPTSISAYGSTLFRQRGLSYRNQRYLFLWLSPSRQVFLQVAGNDYFVGTANLCDLNAWNHVALVRRSGQMQIFLNGYANTPKANTTNFSDSSTYDLMFGSLGFNVDYWFAGNLSNIRIAKSAYYITSFIPDRTPFTRTSQGATNVQLLLNFKNNAGLLTDSSANNITVTNSTLSLVTYSTLTPFSGAFVTPPVVTAASATVTPSTTTPNEGDSITFNVTTANTPDGTYYWSIELPVTEPISTADISGASLTGSFTVTGATGSFVITTLKDLLTEGVETFSMFVRTGSTTGTVLGTSDEISIADTSITPSLTPASSSVNEGSSISFTAANVGPDGTYYWTTGVNPADVSATSGSFTVSGSTGGIDNGTGTFSITTLADRVTEGNETMAVQVRSGSTSGTVVASTSVTITDISLTPSASITSSTQIAERTGGLSGLSDTATVEVRNLGPAGTYYWSILDTFGTMTATDLTAGSLTGSFTTATLNEIKNVTFTAAVDTVAEANGLNAFQVQIRSGSTSGTVIATTGSSISLYDSSMPVAVSPNPASEGNGFNITISTNLFYNQGVVTGTYWLTFESTGSAVAADIVGLPTSFTVTGSGNYFRNGVVSVRATDGAEGAETFRIGVRQGTSTGTLVGLSPIITINASAT